MRVLILFSFLLACFDSVAEREKIGLALSGGGARGTAHVGVLRELEKRNIPIDYIAGTSMGAIVGALYASGYTPDEIENIVNTIDWQAAFEDDVKREQYSFRRKLDNRRFISKLQLGLGSNGFKLPAGIVSGQSIGLILNQHFAPVSHIKRFNQLPIPFWAVTTDLATGEAVILKQGSLSEAVTASMSIPGFLIPVKRNNKLLVDGGIANNLPVSVVREMGADIVIAVDISTPLFKTDELNDVVDVADQLSSLLTRKNTELQLAQLTERDVLLVPELDDIETSDFAKAAMAIPRGEQAAQASKPLSKLSNHLLTQQSQYLRPEKNWLPLDQRKVTDIVVDNKTGISTERIKNKVHLKAGDRFSFKQLKKDIDAIYGMGYFSLVQYSLSSTDKGILVTIHTKEKSWGPNYLRLGFNFSSSEDIDNKFNITANYLMTNINQLNGELSMGIQLGNDKNLDFSWYQPLDSSWSPFIETQINLASDQFNFFDDNQLLAEFSSDTLAGDLSVGVELDNWGEIRFGLHYLDGSVEQEVGMPVLNEQDYQDAYQYFRFEVDTLNSLHFPQDGFLLQYSYARSDADFGSEFDYTQSRTRLLKAFEWQKNSVTIGANYFRSKGPSIPLNAFQRSGGLLNFSGYEINQISSENAAFAFVAYMRRIKPTPFLDMYLGVSYERGQTWSSPQQLDWSSAIEGYSVFLGSDTYLGPFYVAYGKNENAKSFYIMLDKLF